MFENTKLIRVHTKHIYTKRITSYLLNEAKSSPDITIANEAQTLWLSMPWQDDSIFIGIATTTTTIIKYSLFHPHTHMHSR